MEDQCDSAESDFYTNLARLSIINDEVPEGATSRINTIPNDTGTAVVSGSDDDKKIFVGGLNKTWNEKDLRNYFTRFGKIESACIVKDHRTAISKGFGFIVFDTVETCNKVIAAGDHIMYGKKIDVQAINVGNSKVYVRGISSDITEEDIRVHFCQFGKISRVETVFDPKSNERMKYCFVVFESENDTIKVLENPTHTIKHKEVIVKRAVANHNPPAQGFSQNCSQPFGNQLYGGSGFNRQTCGSTLYRNYYTGNRIRYQLQRSSRGSRGRDSRGSGGRINKSRGHGRGSKQ